MSKVTIADLARELGLAKSAVSYALNDRPGVSDETRVRVKELAARRGWRPSPAARALSGGRADAIGIVLGREPRSLAEEPWYHLVIAGVEDILIDADVSLMLRMVGSRGGKGLHTYRLWSQGNRVDGVLVFDGERDDPRLGLLTELGLPAVLVGFRADGFASVSADSESEAETLVAHLHGLGVRDVLYVGGPRDLVHEGRRRDGVLAACARRGMALREADGAYQLEGGVAAMEEALADGLVPEGVVASNDLMAVGTFMALRRAGRSIPVVSWDDSALTRGTEPGITALDRDAMEFGRVAARMLLEQIEGGTAPQAVVRSAQLRVRGVSSPQTRPKDSLTAG